MPWKYLAIATALLSVALAPSLSAAQAAKTPAPAHQDTASPSTAKPTLGPAAPSATSTTSPGTPASTTPPAAASPDTSGSNPNCPNGPCDDPPSHITIATAAPAPAPWPLQERIAWAANILLVLIAYVAIILGLSTLRKIERQTRYTETAAQAAADSAKAMLLHAETQAKADRPWILVTAEPAPGAANSFTVVATNRGRTPARIISLADETVIAKDESALPSVPTFKTAPRAPLAPIILLPGESAALKSFTRDEVNSICADTDQLRRVEDWDEKIYLYGNLTYTDLASPDESQAHETTWCCWYIHGRQKSGMVMDGPAAYSRHT